MKKFDQFEIAAVKSCNLSCAACNHFSPLYKGLEGVSPVELALDLKVLARHVHAKRARILGGEPLLHRNIAELIQVVKASKISDTTRVITNGTLLDRMTDEFWNVVDQVEISLYPGVVLNNEVISKHRKKITINKNPSFREMFSTLHNDDEDLVRKIYKKCNVMDYCIGLVGRHFYRCMRSAFIPENVRHPILNPKTVDGIKVEDTDQFEKAFEVYLTEDRMPVSCYFCVGSSGKSFPHNMPERKAWMEKHTVPISQMVDVRKL